MSEPTEPLDPPPSLPQPVAERPKLRYLVLPHVLLMVFLLTFLSGPLFILSLYMAGPMTEDKTVVVPRGSSVQDIAQILDENDILIDKTLFRITARLLAKNQLKAGEYAIPKGSSVMDVTALLRDGKTVLRQFTAAEGLTSFEIVNLLNATPALSGDLVSLPDEGTLLPETYHYSLNDSRITLIERMQKESRATLEKMWAERDKDLPLASAQEALILASVVEKETGKLAEERPLVASVFINRLRLHMPLQSDPTVIYALTGGSGSLGRKLTRADLLTASPINTYVNVGLPPTPICNPGKAALMAVLHPEKSNYLYFVANGTGGHSFANTLSDHNKNVAKWIDMNRP